MKQCLAMMLVLIILFACAACGAQADTAPALFYLRTDETIRYGEPGALISPIPYEGSQDLSLEEILQIYLSGAVEENYRSPIPKGTYLLSLIYQEDMLTLVLSREFSALDGIQLSLAGACLTATCHSLTGYDTIQVHSGDNVYEFALNDFVFLDKVSGE